MTVHVHMRMPDEERDCGPDDDDIPWDHDVVYPLDGADEEDEEE